MSAPLDGIRVVDLTVVWSGPGGTALLGDLGAEVIRPEGNNRRSRQAPAKVDRVEVETGYHGGTYPDRDPGERPYDRSAMFNWHSRNKLAVCMNLETPEGHEALLELVKISDVLVENNSVGTLEKLGLDEETLLQANPRLIVARMPPLGLTGEMSGYIGYGPNFNALVGLAAMDGYEGETPDTAGENYHMDESAPAGIAFAVLAALWDRERTGKGGLIEFSQAENVLQELGEYYLDFEMNHRNPPILGNTDPWILQDSFPTSEDDLWVAVSVRDDQDWQNLCDVIDEDWADPALDSSARTSRSKELRSDLSEWTAKRTGIEIVEALQSRGVPAARVMTELQLLEDPHLAERDWFKVRSHPSVGTYPYPGQPWKAEGFETPFGRILPGFGEDNEYVYRELLGYSEEKYNDLVSRGLVTDVQLV